MSIVLTSQENSACLPGVDIQKAAHFSSENVYFLFSARNKLQVQEPQEDPLKQQINLIANKFTVPSMFLRIFIYLSTFSSSPPRPRNTLL